jgi:hypothetical protein
MQKSFSQSPWPYRNGLGWKDFPKYQDKIFDIRPRGCIIITIITIINSVLNEKEEIKSIHGGKL